MRCLYESECRYISLLLSIVTNVLSCYTGPCRSGKGPNDWNKIISFGRVGAYSINVYFTAKGRNIAYTENKAKGPKRCKQTAFSSRQIKHHWILFLTDDKSLPWPKYGSSECNDMRLCSCCEQLGQFTKTLIGLFVLRTNTLRPRQNRPHFPDDIFKCIFSGENVKFRLIFHWALFSRVKSIIP